MKGDGWDSKMGAVRQWPVRQFAFGLLSIVLPHLCPLCLCGEFPSMTVTVPN